MSRNARISLILDYTQAVADALKTERAVDGIGDAAARAAKKVDSEFERGFKSVASSAKTHIAGAVQSFIGNLAANAFGAATRAASDFFTGSIRAAAEASDAQRFLASSVAQVGGNFAQAKQAAMDLAAQLGLTNAQAERLLAQATLRTSGTGRDPVAFLRAFADAAAAAGQSVKNLDINSLFTSDEVLNRIGLADPGFLKEQFAKKLGVASTSLSPEQEAQAIIDAVLQKGGGLNQGAAGARLGDIGGQLDQIASKIENIQASVGTFLSRNQGVRDLINFINEGLSKMLEGGNAFGMSMDGVRRVTSIIGSTIGDVAGLALQLMARLNVVSVTLETSFGIWPKALKAAFLEVNASARDSLADFVEAIKGLPSPVRGVLFGAGAAAFDNLNPSEIRGTSKASALLAQADLVQFALGQDKRIGAALDGVIDAEKKSEEFARRGAAIGARFGEFAPVSAPGATGPGGIAANMAAGAAGVAGVATALVETVEAMGILGNVPTLTSINAPGPGALSAAAQAATEAKDAQVDNTQAMLDLIASNAKLEQELKNALVKIEVTAGASTSVGNLAPVGAFARGR